MEETRTTLWDRANRDTVVSRNPNRSVYADTEQHTPHVGCVTGSIQDMANVCVW